MRKAFRVSVLLMALSCPIYAGEIGYGAPAPPPSVNAVQGYAGEIGFGAPAPPPSVNAVQETARGGIMDNGTRIALHLLRSVLALF